MDLLNANQKEGVEAGKSIFDKIKSMIDMLKEVLPRLVSALNNQEAFDIKIRFVEMDKGFEAGGARTELQEKLAKAGRDVLAGSKLTLGHVGTLKLLC